MIAPDAAHRVDQAPRARDQENTGLARVSSQTFEPAVHLQGEQDGINIGIDRPIAARSPSGDSLAKMLYQATLAAERLVPRLRRRFGRHRERLLGRQAERRPVESIEAGMNIFGKIGQAFQSLPRGPSRSRRSCVRRRPSARGAMCECCKFPPVPLDINGRWTRLEEPLEHPEITSRRCGIAFRLEEPAGPIRLAAARTVDERLHLGRVSEKYKFPTIHSKTAIFH